MKVAVILAAGMGTRLNLGSFKGPKGFININGESIVLKSINKLKQSGITNIIIGTGYLQKYYKKIEDNNSIFCINNNNYDTSGSLFTLFNLRDYINEDFLLLESDIIYEKRALDILIKHEKKDIILASDKTNSKDEVFLEASKDKYLLKLSKNKNDLKNIYGELVGISKVSLNTFQKLVVWVENNINTAKNMHYEKALEKISKKKDIYVEKINDLVWAEIDTKEHYDRAINYIYPKILERESR